MAGEMTGTIAGEVEFMLPRVPELDREAAFGFIQTRFGLIVSAECREERAAIAAVSLTEIRRLLA